MAHLLHDTFKDDKKLEELRKKSVEDVESIRKSCEVLRSYRFKVRTVEDVKSLSREEINKKVAESKQGYLDKMDGIFINQAQIDSTLAMMEEARKRGGDAAEKVATILSEYEGVPYRMDSKGRLWFDQKELEAFLNAKATYKVPAFLKEYYTKLGDVIDDLNELRKFEKDNGLSEFSAVGPYQNTPTIQGFFYDSEKDVFAYPAKAFLWLWQNGFIGESPDIEAARKAFREKWGNYNK